MKELLCSLICLLPVGLTVIAQGSYNDPNVEVRSINGFSGIKVATGIDLVLTQGEVEAVAVSANKPENRDNIRTEIKNGVLHIYHRGDIGKWGKSGDVKNLKAYVSAITIHSLTISSGATIKIEGKLKSGNLEIDLSSGGTFKGEIDASGLKVVQGSGSTATVSGVALSADIRANSGAGFYSYSLAVDKCYAKATTGSTVEITVNKELEASAKTGGSVSYMGACSVKKNGVNTGGSVRNKS